MRQKKSVLQIGEETYHENPNFKIQMPADYNEQQSSFEKKSSITKLKHMFSNPQLMNPQQQNHRNHYRKNPQNSLTCCSSSEALLATKTVVLKVLKLNHVKLFWIKAPSRVLILLCLPSVYFFSLNYHQSLYLYILFLITLCILLLSLLNLPSIRLFIARNLSIFNLSNIGNATKISPPVVWSIGSKNQFESSTITGFLVKVYSNGDVYEGEFYKGKCSGSGVYYYNMNGRYEGDWIDQKYDGYGVETWAKGSRYRGQYRQGLRHGYGVYRFFTGDMYAGEWIKGQCHGRGVHTCDDGSKYFGEFKGGVKHGLGHYHFRNGDMYAGEYFADRMHGFGVYNFANGHRYEGAWHEGRRQGFGMYSFRNGDTQLGHWNDGVLTVSPPSVPNSKVLNSVEEARRMAEKAIGGDVVEEKVNRAVAAANRAANAARVAAVKAVQRRVDHRTDIDDPTLLIV